MPSYTYQKQHGHWTKNANLLVVYDAIAKLDNTQVLETQWDSNISNQTWKLLQARSIGSNITEFFPNKWRRWKTFIWRGYDQEGKTVLKDAALIGVSTQSKAWRGAQKSKQVLKIIILLFQVACNGKHSTLTHSSKTVLGKPAVLQWTQHWWARHFQAKDVIRQFIPQWCLQNEEHCSALNFRSNIWGAERYRLVFASVA